HRILLSLPTRRSSDLKGSYSNSIMPGSIAFEAFAKAPDQRLEVLQYPGGDALTGYSHGMGWVKGRPSAPAYAMSSAAAEYFSYFADMHSAAHLQQRFAKFRMEPPEKIGDREAYVVVGLQHGPPPVTFYFDQQSGLLLRMVRYTETPLGAN